MHINSYIPSSYCSTYLSSFAAYFNVAHKLLPVVYIDQYFSIVRVCDENMPRNLFIILNCRKNLQTIFVVFYLALLN